MNRQPTDLEIYEMVNATTCVGELKDILKVIWGESGIFSGRTEPFSVIEMNLYIDLFAEDFPKVISGEIKTFTALPTRKYGIRQQLCMILLNPTR